MAEQNVFTSHDMPRRSFKYFEELRSKEELCDFTIKVGDESISAHRVIVTAVIPYFRDVLLSESVKPGEAGIVLPDIEPSALKYLIEFAYTCKVRISEENVRSLFSAACYLNVDEVRDACFDFLWNQMKPESALDVREFVGNMNCPDLTAKVDCYVRENFDRVAQTKDFLTCSYSYLVELIEKDDLNVPQEENVFQSVMNWVKASPDGRKMHLPDLLANVRMTFVRPLYLIDIVKKEELVRTSLACRDLIDEGRNYISHPETRTDPCSFKTQARKSLTTTSVSQEKGTSCIWKFNALLKYTAQHFDLTKGKWVTKEGKSFYANDGSAVEMDNKMYFFRWGDTLQFDQVNNDYKFLVDVPTPRILVGASRLKDHIYLCGGRVGKLASDVVECFSPEKNTWSKISSMPKSLWATSVVSLGDYIYVLGGQDHRSVHSSVERYDSVLDKWESMPSMNFKRSFTGAAVLNGKIYVCGGNTSPDSITPIAASEVYNPITRSWQSISDMSTPRCWYFLLAYNEKLYAIGGKHENKSVDYFDIYHTSSNKWTTGPSTGTKILTSAAVVMPLSNI